ncbi:hypothetical protein GCM10010517_17080 [Streptosporangium fragile]|uniref:Uncharacterized protein n=1 Tax=Streptosporangium fragile TaxID=46186 RepID=A0ABP6IBQ6_9ACTN
MAPTGEFCGIDPGEMGRLADSLRGAADRLTSFSKEFEAKLGRHGIGTPALREIADIAEWGKTQVSMLHGRAELIQALDAGAGPASAGDGAQGFVRLPDELAGFEFAQGLARMYGNDILVNHSGELQAALIHEHADEIAQLAENPQAAAAFFALLPSKVRDALPAIIASTGSKTARQDLAAFSKALGAALRAPTLVPAFAKVRNDLVRPVEGKIVAWNRLALLRGANAPSGVRSAAARALVLDDFLKNPRQDWRAGSIESRTYGTPPDLVAMGLEVLAGDGAAVRDAFAKMGGSDLKLSQTEKMKRFLDHAKGAGGDDVADAFGRAMEAGTGATTEKAGQHSPEAAAFTLDLMKVAGSFGADLPKPAKDSMGVIAKSYIHELASGARFDKAAYRTSGMGLPENWITLPGVTPAFYLSPGDTHRFLKSFVGDKRLTDDFDATAARFRHDTLTAAAHLDAHTDDGYFELASSMFGDFAGLEFKATLDVRGELDATDELIRDITKSTLALGIDRIPIVGGIKEAGWELAKAYGASKLLDNWADSFETRVEEATGSRSDFVLRLKYDTAHLLHSAGYPASEPPAEIISRTTGGLQTYDELVSAAKKETSGSGTRWEQALGKKLIAYERWMDSNKKLDIKLENSSRIQASETAQEQIRVWE